MRYKTTTRIPFELPSSSKQGLSDAPKDTTEAAVAFYTDKRASNTLPSDMYTLTNFDELKRYIQVRSDYMQKQIRSNQEKIEPISKQPANTGMTICVPVAIRHETPETIERLMKQLTAASAGIENGIHVVVWANAKATPSQKQFTQKQCKPLYDRLRQQFTSFNSDAMTISTAFEVICTDGFIMNVVRNNFMEAVIARLMDGEIDIDHPILWLDADTTRIRPNTLRTVQQDIKKHPFGFCHPNIDYSLEWLEGIRPQDWDAYSKLLFVDEMVRRAFRRVACQRFSSENSIEDRIYAEESGLAFPLSTYLASGGLYPEDLMGESSHLRRRYMRYGAKFLRKLYRPEITNPHLDDIRWLDASGIGIETSARRVHHTLHKQPIGSTTFSRAQDANYTLSTEQEEFLHDQAPNTDRIETLARIILTRKRGVADEELQQDARKRVERMLRNRALGFNLPEEFFKNISTYED